MFYSVRAKCCFLCKTIHITPQTFVNKFQDDNARVKAGKLSKANVVHIESLRVITKRIKFENVMFGVLACSDVKFSVVSSRTTHAVKCFDTVFWRPYLHFSVGF